jgi:hypothetical protein
MLIGGPGPYRQASLLRACSWVRHRVYISEPPLPFVFVCDVAGGTGPDRTGVYFLKRHVGFAEFVGVKILYALAMFTFLTP